MRWAAPLALVLSISGIQNAQALDEKGLGALQNSVKELCVQPDRKGTLLTVEGDLGAGATLKVVGVNGSGKITRETWDGISQKLDKYKTDPRECAISILGMLIPVMSPPPRDCTGRRIDGYRREFEVSRDSQEMGGGFDQRRWCDSVIASLRGEQPGGAFTVVRSGERTKNHCKPFNCPQYTYSCTVKVQADPICQ